MNPVLKRLYWQLTALLLAAHFAGCSSSLDAAIALSGVQVAHVAILSGGQWRALDLQVRLVFFALLGVGTLPGMEWLHLLQFAGINGVLVADYCLLARLLSLLPWNRSHALSWALVRRVLLLPPTPGSITARLAATDQAAGR
jgi:hypothetical protein